MAVGGGLSLASLCLYFVLLRERIFPTSCFLSRKIRTGGGYRSSVSG